MAADSRNVRQRHVCSLQNETVEQQTFQKYNDDINGRIHSEYFILNAMTPVFNTCQLRTYK
jgi:hypothetical protein